jgi:hypothetical protein
MFGQFGSLAAPTCAGCEGVVVAAGVLAGGFELVPRAAQVTPTPIVRAARAARSTITLIRAMTTSFRRLHGSTQRVSAP